MQGASRNWGQAGASSSFGRYSYSATPTKPQGAKKRNFAPLPNYSPTATASLLPASARWGPPPQGSWPIDVCLDVEVSDTWSRDIDDTLLLILAAGDPRVNLRCVTVTPGTRYQMSVVRHILTLAGKADSVVVGATDWPNNLGATLAAEVSPSAKALGALEVDREWETAHVLPAADAMARTLCNPVKDGYTVMTGAGLTNFAAALRLLEGEGDAGRPFVRSWLGQGGYASQSAVLLGAKTPQQLPETHGNQEELSPSYNVSQDAEATEYLLSSVGSGSGPPGLIQSALFISSKLHAEDNVMTSEWTDRLGNSLAREASIGTARFETLNAFAAVAPRMGKKLHDLVLLAAALDPSVCDWTGAVELYSKRIPDKKHALWGARPVPNGRDGKDERGVQHGVRISYWLNESAYVNLLLPLQRSGAPGFELPYPVFGGTSDDSRPGSKNKRKRNRLQ